jgi:hypothetical protein
MSTSPTTQSVSTKQVNAQNWLNDRLCSLNSDDFRPDSIAIYTICNLLCLTSSLMLHTLGFNSGEIMEEVVEKDGI